MAGKSRFSIFGEIKLIDRVSGPMKRATMSVNNFANSANKSINRVAGRGAQAGMIGLSVGAGLVAREFVKFDDAIFGATARFKAALPAGTNMTKVMEDLRKTARRVGAQTQFTAAQAAAGLNKFALAGFTPAEAMKSLRSVIDLTTATGEDFTRVTDISTDLLGAFGGAALTSAKKVEKLKEMNALLAVATLSANVTMEDLFETLKIAAPIATQLGIGMKDVIATTSVLGSAGIKGSMAATALKNVMLNLVDPASKSAKALGRLGIAHKEIITDSGKLKPMSQIFALIGNRMKSTNKTAVEQAAIFKELFGLRGIAGAAVIAKNLPLIRKQLIAMGKDPQKVLQQTANFMRKSMGNRLKILGSAATELGFKIFNAFAGKGRDGLDKLTKTIQNFDVTPIVEGLKIIFGILGFIGRNLNILIPLFIGFKVAMIASTIATTAFGVALGATGIGLIIIGVSLLIMYFMRLQKQTGSVGGAFKQMGLDLLRYVAWPINMTLTYVSKLLWLLSKVPGSTGRWAKSAMMGVDNMQGKFNNMFKVSPTQTTTTAPGAGGDVFGALGAAAGSIYASPNSRGVTNTTNTNVGINVNAPAGTTMDRTGNKTPNVTSTLNTGVQN